jgi:hydroxymethylbilane synthase
MSRAIRIGTRASALARWQSRFVIDALLACDPSPAFEVVPISTEGDELPEALLADFEGTGFFTSTLERALLAGDIDVAVHSYKDLPVSVHPALVIAAVPARGPVEDVLCSRGHVTLRALPHGARVGTSSARRSAQLRARRADLELVPLRGNVPTRIERVRECDLDAIVLARAGLTRLGLDAAISEVFAPDDVLPAPAQGALAIQARVADRELVARLAALDHGVTRAAVEAERGLLHALGGGCSVPVGAYGTADADGVRLSAGVFALDGARAIRATGAARLGAKVAADVARELIARGAMEILGAGDRALRPAPEVAWPCAWR